MCESCALFNWINILLFINVDVHELFRQLALVMSV